VPLKKYAVESGTRTHRQRVRGAARWPLDVFIEASVRSDGQARIARAAPGDVSRVESDYGRTFTTAPTVYVFATRSSFGPHFLTRHVPDTRLGSTPVSAPYLESLGRSSRRHSLSTRRRK